MFQEGGDDTLGDLPSFSNDKGKNYNAEMASQPGQGIRKPSFSAARDIDISNHRGMHIILPATASRATSSGNVADLQGCVLDMSVPTLKSGKPSPFKSLAIKNVTRSLIIVGHVAGPVHITGVKDSLLVINARQVRIHECDNVAVYLWSGSHPIIEDCKAMRFAEIPVCYVSHLNPLAQPSLRLQCTRLMNSVRLVDGRSNLGHQPMEPSRRL